MPEYRIVVSTVIEITADNEDAAAEEFYDSVYEVDRHGSFSIEEIKN